MRKRSQPFNARRNARNASEPASREYHPNLMSKRATDTPGTDALNWVRTDTKHPETVVLLHAVGYDLTYWDRQIEALRASYNVVAFDLPGHGRSPGEPEDWTWEKSCPDDCVADRSCQRCAGSPGRNFLRRHACAGDGSCKTRPRPHPHLDWNGVDVYRGCPKWHESSSDAGSNRRHGCRTRIEPGSVVYTGVQTWLGRTSSIV